MTTTLETTPKLSAADVAEYRRNGYLIHRQPLFPEEKFRGLQNCFETILAASPGDVRPEGLDVPHFGYPALFEWLFSDEVLNLVQPLLGPDIALFSSHFICKPRGNGKRVPWHEDSSYWKGMLDPMEVVTVWLAIDPSTRANGCMQVIPATFHGFSDYEPVDPDKNVFSTEIVRHQRDEARAVALELEPNQASLHDGRIMHGSEPNTSAIRRCGYTMRYISTRTKFNHAKYGEFHTIFLARGRDHAGNVYGDPTVVHEDLLRSRTKHGKSGH
jgi:hypothetical protein